LSHSRQRKDKICLNCTAALHGRYCHQCGQENVEPQETAWSLVTHFLYDITHFDGKFFSTLKYLLFRPGFLSKEYIRGRRASYLHPIRMYVFTSAMFFIFFFSMVQINDLGFDIKSPGVPDSLAIGLNESSREIMQNMGVKGDTAQINAAVNRFQRGLSTIDDSISAGGGNELYFLGLKYKTKTAYDSAQLQLPPDERDGPRKRAKVLQKIENRQRISEEPEEFLKDAGNELLHKFPQLLFISLPFFALILKLLYHRRKDIYYSEHGIFSIHLYIFTFIAIFFLLVTNYLEETFSLRWLSYVETIIVLLMFFYTYKALRNFYLQGRFKTFLKFLLLHFLSAMMLFFLFLVFVFLAIYEI
jgi:hypothetical protein